MAATDAKPIPVYGYSYRISFPIQNATGFQSAAAGLDSKCDKDGAGMTDCTNEAAEIGSSGIYTLDLTAAEMTAALVSGVTKTSSAGAYPVAWSVTPWRLPVVRTCTAQAAGTDTTHVQLDTGACAVDSYYNGCYIGVDSGAAAGEAHRIVSYVGATKIAEVWPAFSTNPGAATVSVLQANISRDVNAVAAGTIPALLAAGSVASVTGAVGSVTGVVRANLIQRNGLPIHGAVQQLASGCTLPSGKTTSATTVTSRIKYLLPQGCESLSLFFWNGYAGSNTPINEQANGNAIGLKVAIETSDGKILPVYFAGVRSITLADNATATTDALTLHVEPGGYIWVRTYSSVTAGQYWPTMMGRTDAQIGEGRYGADYADSGTVAPSTDVFFAPCGIIGVPAATGKSDTGVLVIGDSIAASYYDWARGQAITGQSGGGWVRRSMNGVVPYVQAAISGDRLEYLAGTTRSVMLALAAYCPHIVIALGVNDLSNARSVATMQGYLATIIAALPRTAQLHIVSTTPKPTSTDGFTTVENQTADAYLATREAWNAWCKTVPASFRSCIDMASVAESGTTGKWVVPPDSPVVLASGTATGGSTTYLDDAGAGWTPGQFQSGAAIKITGGQGAGQTIPMSAATTNTATRFTFNAAVGTGPTAGSTYEIIQTYVTDAVHPSPAMHELMGALVLPTTRFAGRDDEWRTSLATELGRMDAAVSDVPDAIMQALVATYKDQPGTLAEAVNFLWRRMGMGAAEDDQDAGTITYRDGSTTSDPVLLTQRITETPTTTVVTPE